MCKDLKRSSLKYMSGSGWWNLESLLFQVWQQTAQQVDIFSRLRSRQCCLLLPAIAMMQRIRSEMELHLLWPKQRNICLPFTSILSHPVLPTYGLSRSWSLSCSEVKLKYWAQETHTRFPASLLLQVSLGHVHVRDWGHTRCATSFVCVCLTFYQYLPIQVFLF